MKHARQYSPFRRNHADHRSACAMPQATITAHQSRGLDRELRRLLRCSGHVRAAIGLLRRGDDAVTMEEITLALFAACNSVRVVAYVPQILKAAADKNGASSISCTTWTL